MEQDWKNDVSAKVIEIASSEDEDDFDVMNEPGYQDLTQVAKCSNMDSNNGNHNNKGIYIMPTWLVLTIVFVYVATFHVLVIGVGQNETKSINDDVRTPAPPFQDTTEGPVIQRGTASIHGEISDPSLKYVVEAFSLIKLVKEIKPSFERGMQYMFLMWTLTLVFMWLMSRDLINAMRLTSSDLINAIYNKQEIITPK